jgi:hypothetical protein
MRPLIHDIRNELAVAVANVEAVRDGVLDATPERLERVLEALARADALLAGLRDAGER